MKKFKLLLLILLGICFIPNVYAADDVKIESISVAEKSEDTEELTPASFSGLDVNLDVKFLNEKDHIKYNVVVANNSNKDYDITNTTKFGESDHIKYVYSYNNGNSVVKANTKQTMQIDVIYERKVDENELDASGRYVENKNMVVSLSRKTSNIINPKTSSILIVLIVFVTIIAIVSILGLKRNKKVTAMLLAIALSLPISILALDELQIKVNSKVTIDSIIEFCVVDYGLASEETGFKAATPSLKGVVEAEKVEKYEDYINYTYRYKVLNGMTFEDFRNSKFYNQVGNETPKNEDIYDLYNNTSMLSVLYNKENTKLFKYTKGELGYKRIEKGSVIEPCDKALYEVYSLLQESES